MGHNSWEDFFFLGKNCSWTLLPAGSISLQTPIIQFYLRSKKHFASLKCADDLWVYQVFMMPLNHQACKHARYFKRALKSIISLFCLMGFPIHVLFHITITNLITTRFPGSDLISYFPSTYKRTAVRFWETWFWLWTL